MADVEERPQKRSKVSDASQAFHEGLLEDESVNTIKTAFATSKPYLHCKIDRLINDDLLRKVRTEIKENLHFTIKETDIYKVNQTGDLANLDGLPVDELNKLQSLFELRNALYSQTFREFIRNVTGCGALSGTMTDMSINNYRNGCHLLNHDDVIGTRRVSYILYLTDPDSHWDPKNGGALELYPVVEKGTPATEPTVVIPPQWNQFVMFTVQPGHSFHSVEEVVVDKDRLSISGWFHIPQKGEVEYREQAEAGEAKSSLEQLQQIDSSAQFTHYATPLTEDVAGLTEETLKTLAEWMNPHFLDVTILTKMADRFLDESAVECKEFLNKDLAQQVAAVTKEADERDGLSKRVMAPHGCGVGHGWACHGPPHKQRFLVAEKPDDAASKLMLDLQQKFESEAFRQWLALLTQLLPQGFRGAARRFRPGHDYTLATTNTRGQGVLDVTLVLAAAPDAKNKHVWEDGDCGAYECYMAPHDEEEDAAVYKAASEDGALLTLTAGFNSLTLVLRDEGVMRFIKYVSARAPGSRWDVAYEYDLPEEEEDEEEEEEEEEQS